MSLRRTLFFVIALVPLLGLGLAGYVMSDQLESALLERTRSDLHRAGMVLSERWEAMVGIRMMHAKDLANIPGVAEALAEGRVGEAISLMTPVANQFGEQLLLVDAEGESVVGGMDAPVELAAATLGGSMPVDVADIPEGLHLVALAPVMHEGEWLAAAGGTTPFDASEAGTLAGLTRAGVIFVTDGEPSRAVVSTLPDSVTEAILPFLAEAPLDSVMTVGLGSDEVMALAANLRPGLRIVFARNLSEELGVLPGLQRTGLVAGAAALALALLLAALLAARISGPVVSLADAADRLAKGDDKAPIPMSGVSEVRRMAEAFDAMRSALRSRLDQLQTANAELENRQTRLARLQAELVQRERAASAGQLAAHLAHEIRNPIASVRNCLEILKRRTSSDEEAVRFADLAIDELLRMHELAERMLGLGRTPTDHAGTCDGVKIAAEVAELVNAGSTHHGTAPVAVVGDRAVPALAAMSGDALKQVLFNLVLNAREAAAEGPVEIVVSASRDPVTIEVLDRGPGIPQDHLERIFDPFFSTKDKVRGVGLGLFMAQAMIQARRGRLFAENRGDGPGARFVLELPASDGTGEERDAGPNRAAATEARKPA